MVPGHIRVFGLKEMLWEICRGMGAGFLFLNRRWLGGHAREPVGPRGTR